MTNLSEYFYQLPKELVALKPADPRDSARLLVYQKKNQKTTFDTFKNLHKHLPKNALLVFNQTRVLPARLKMYKPTGGRVEILYLNTEKNMLNVLANKNLKIGEYLSFTTSPVKQKSDNLKIQVEGKTEKGYLLKPAFPLTKLKSVLTKFGQTPLPPYLKHSPLSEKERKLAYQTIFAKSGTSAAAPTASLHFTKDSMKKLKNHGIKTAFVRLDVSLGTFAPLTPKNISSGKLHSEYYQIDKKTIHTLKTALAKKQPVIAVGTTVARTLESWANSGKTFGSTDIFIKPPYKFKVISGLITNFHVPKSSLMMLVASLVGRKQLLQLYKKAITKKLRFYSFGDGMLILP